MWLYNNKEFTSEDIGDYYGFVYLITNLKTDKKYIGKKTFTFTKTKQIKKKKKRIKVESDWKEYYGSNKELLEDVNKLGKENFKREILMLCSSKGSCSYYEARQMFLVDALLSEDYYNSWMTLKVSKSHIKN